MKKYLDLLQKIVNEGTEKESGRANMPNTIGISHAHISHDLSEGFPLLTTKKMYWKGIIHELLWFLRGDTNIKYLVDNNVHIWDKNAYRWYEKACKSVEGHIPVSNDDFIELIKVGILETNIPNYRLGDLGKVYGYQWRNQNGVDQVKNVIEGLQTNPYSRYHVINAWNASDFSEMALPPCHLLYQFIVRPMNACQREDYIAQKHNMNLEQRFEMNPNMTDEDVNQMYDEEDVPKFYLDLSMFQRSVDTFLGLPFNIASMAALNMIIAKACNMVPGEIHWTGGDTHLYKSHIFDVNEEGVIPVRTQLERTPMRLPKLEIKKDIKSLEDILSLSIEDFELINYVSRPAIKAEMYA